MAGDSLGTTQVATRARWWKGTRGEWLVVTQVALISLLLFGPRSWPDAGLVPFSYPPGWSFAGLVLMAAGLGLMLAGGQSLGRSNLTPLPRPREEGQLVERGAYGVVRHPMYGGGVIFAFGWTLWVRGPLTLGYALALFVFVDLKARREERWLREKFSGYTAYQARVRKLIPFIY